MIAVTDKHSVSSGIQYVPVLASPFKVNIIRRLSLMIAVVFMDFTFFVLIFSVYMYMRTEKVEFGLFALLCICVLGYGSYPILHSFVAVKVQPCYGMESLFYYLMFAGVMLVQQKILGGEERIPEILAGVAAADRIWRLYEPIIGGWFTEIGAAVLVASVGLTLWMELANAYRFQLTYGEYSRQMEQKLQIQKQNYEELTEKMDEISRMRHDMRHHLRTIMSYTQQGKYQEMMEYLQEYASVITEEEKLICYCRNMAVDAVKDLLPENKPYVKMLTKVKNRKLLIEISNPYSNEIQRREKVFYSTKHEGFGIGFLDVIHIYDTASVTGEKTFHSLQKLFEFLEGYVGAYNACICGMYLNCIAVGIHVQDAPDRELYRGTVGDQLYISGILRLPELDC